MVEKWAKWDTLFYRDNGYCKFGKFVIFPTKSTKNIDNSEVKDLEKKILAMENYTKEKDDLIKDLEIKLSDRTFLVDKLKNRTA